MPESRQHPALALEVQTWSLSPSSLLIHLVNFPKARPLLGEWIGRELVAQEAADHLFCEDDRIQRHKSNSLLGQTDGDALGRKAEVALAAVAGSVLGIWCSRGADLPSSNWLDVFPTMMFKKVHID